MVEHLRAPKGEQSSRAAKVAAEEPQLTPKQQQALAHSRGRICKMKGCEICAPLRESRRLKKAQRKADAQAQAHARGEPCGRSNCPEAVCVKARYSDDATPAPPVQRTDESKDDPDEMRRRQTERHRAGMTCGFESCPNHLCVEGFAQERARRHRARRPCKSLDCANPICAASRAST